MRSKGILLQWYQHQYPHQKEQGCDNLTQEQRKIAFHLWAAYDRAELLKTSTEEHLMCPMLWCRESFPDFEMTLRHTSSCPWLSNGWYWCPSCGRPEQFLEGKSSRVKVSRHSTSLTLKRAVTFFRNIGLRTHSRIHRPTSCTSSTTDLCEMSDESAGASVLCEVDAESSYLKELAGNDCEIYEIEGNENCLSTAPYEPPHDHMHVDQISGFPLPGSGNPPNYDDAPSLEHIADPDSPPDDPFSFMRSSRNVHNDDLPPVPAYEYHDAMLSVKISSTELQVEDLRKLVHVFHHEWTKKLHLVSEYKAPQLASLFETGVRALQKCYGDKLPDNFDEVFALLHIAFAMTYTMHGNDASYPWTEFFHDMLQWKDAIPDRREAWLLTTAIKLLQAPQQGPVVLKPNYDCSAPAGTTTTTSTTVQPICTSDIRPFSTVGAQHSFGNHRPPHTVAEALPTTLIDTLKNGKVLYECSSFFNTFEHGIVAESANKYSQPAWHQQQHATYEHVPHAEEMIYKITRPLRAYMGMEAFHGCIIDAESQLRNGLLYFTREVEVFLLSSGRVYQEYFKKVTALCDDYMHEASRDWREKFYIADLERIFIISLEIDNSRRRTTSSLLQQSIQPTRNFANSNQTYESHTPSMSKDLESPMNSSPSTTTSRTQLDASQSISTDRSTHSPVMSPTTWSSSPSPTQAVDTACCKHCYKLFTGDDRMANLKRHETTSKSCGKGRRFECTVSGCKSLFRRTDYRAKHLRKVHNHIISIHSTGVMKSRRNSAKV
ncbi:hypothetical protein N7G274_005599 [Stereocaulon virgatum]|uniref:C2H2-type domain-containing protein n=1 Tax=Stereocaulon virgatum TaxID=373712 RepID=A0ABR4A8K2_9LECA